VRSRQLIHSAGVLAIAACSKATSNGDAPRAPRSAASASVSASSSHQPAVQWGPAPDVLPPGAQIAVLEGNPGAAGEFTLRLKFPNGYRIPPHTHPTAENVTVLTGTFLAGVGTTFYESDLQSFQRDDFLTIPANHPHYAMARGETVVQVHGVGPFTLTYVNPADAVAR
jgi:quercetin dioxygenase-like cupin family protein